MENNGAGRISFQIAVLYRRNVILTVQGCRLCVAVSPLIFLENRFCAFIGAQAALEIIGLPTETVRREAAPGVISDIVSVGCNRWPGTTLLAVPAFQYIENLLWTLLCEHVSILEGVADIHLLSIDERLELLRSAVVGLEGGSEATLLMDADYIVKSIITAFGKCAVPAFGVYLPGPLSFSCPDLFHPVFHRPFLL